jgi:hypothetical protein
VSALAGAARDRLRVGELMLERIDLMAARAFVFGECPELAQDQGGFAAPRRDLVEIDVGLFVSPAGVEDVADLRVVGAMERPFEKGTVSGGGSRSSLQGS